MTIQELGSLGEVIGAVAVLVTLIYLSLQTRQARLAAEETAKFAQIQATHSVVDVYARWRAHIIGNPSLAEALVKAKSGGSLDPEEEIAVVSLFQDLFFSSSFSYNVALTDGSFHDPAADVAYIVGMFETHPISRKIWEDIKDIVAGLGKEFVAAVDREVTRNA